MTGITGKANDISQRLQGHFAINSAGNEIPANSEVFDSTLPDGITPAMWEIMQQHRNDFCAGVTHNVSGLMMDRWKENPSNGQITASIPMGIDTFSVTGTMNNNVPHFLTTFQTNGGQQMHEVHQHLQSLGASIAKQ